MKFLGLIFFSFFFKDMENFKLRMERENNFMLKS